MARSKAPEVPLPKKLDDLVEFFETHDMGEYWDQMPEAHFDVDIKKSTHLIAIDEDNRRSDNSDREVKEDLVGNFGQLMAKGEDPKG